MSEPKNLEQNPRIQREEEYWTAPRLFAFGFGFLGACIALIYLMATLAFSSVSG